VYQFCEACGRTLKLKFLQFASSVECSDRLGTHQILYMLSPSEAEVSLQCLPFFRRKSSEIKVVSHAMLELFGFLLGRVYEIEFLPWYTLLCDYRN
jgi:hypothetical protein